MRVFRPADGLPGSSVIDITQDLRGLLCLATPRGLFSFNGYEFASIPLPGLHSQILQSVDTDRRGRVWVVSSESEVGYIEDGRFRLLHSLPTPLGPPLVMPDGTLWLRGGPNLMRVEGDPPVVVRFDVTGVYRGGNGIAGIYEMPGGTPIMRADGGQLLVVEGELEPGRFRLVPLGAPLGRQRHVRHDSTGLWLLDAERLVLRRALAGTITTFGPGSAEFEALRRDGAYFRERFVASDGAEWLTYSEGHEFGDYFLVRRTGDGPRRVDLRRHLEFRSFGTPFEDREGSIWVPTDRGLVQLTPRPILELTGRHGLAEEFTVAIRRTRDGSLWVGTWGGGLHRFVAGELVARLTRGNGLPDDRVRALYEADDGRLWVGTEQGWAVLRGGRPVADRRMHEQFRAFARTRDGRFWAGTAHRLLFQEDGEFREFRPDVFRDRRIWALHPTPEGLWVGSENGLFRVVAGSVSDSVERYGADDGLRSQFVASIHEDATGTLWFGTYADGLHRYREGRFTALTTAEGLHHDGIWRMIEDERGGVWMSSDGGIARVEFDHLHETADALARGERPGMRLDPLLFTEAEGMPSRESNRGFPGGWRLDDGRIVFNNVAGLAIVDPDRALRRPPPPAAEIGGMVADGQPVGSATLAGGEVPSGTKHLAFEFVAYSYIAPGQNRYRYRLDGYDDDWIEAGDRRRTEYTGLPPGRYTFRVQGASGPGGWGDPAALAFVIPPLVWQTWWFRLGLASALVGLLAVAYRSRVRHLLEVQRLRLQIASDLHDDVGSNLGSIVLLSQMLAGGQTLDGLERRQLERIRAAAEETVMALRDIIWLVDPRHSDVTDLVRRMRSAAANLLDGNEFSFEAPPSLDARAVDMVWMHNVFLVYKEALHNAARHAPGSRVAIEISLENAGLRLEVRDDGPGFDYASDGRGYGLKTMRRRAEDIGGRLELESGPGAGTTVRLVAPLP